MWKNAIITRLENARTLKFYVNSTARLCINKVAYIDSRDKKMDFSDFTGCRINRYFQMVANPGNIDFLTGISSTTILTGSEP